MRTRIDEMIEALEGWDAGKLIEFRTRGTGMWMPVSNPTWDFHAYDYRITPDPPKPREGWLVEHKCKDCCRHQQWFDDDKPSPWQSCLMAGCTYTLFREVLE